MEKRTIKLLAMDVDGTLTDGKIHISAKGELFKSFYAQDGYGIACILPSCNIRPAIITGRSSEIVAARAKELGITELYQGVHDKREILEQLTKKYALFPEEIAFIGDDLNDAPAAAFCGLTFAPANAAASFAALADVVLTKNGGAGAVRECIEYILANKLY